jgi:beta-N-acetylhexosaminidase
MSYPVGQHLFIGFRGTELDADSRVLVNTIQPGGVVLFARNVDSAPQFRRLTQVLRTESKSQPVIAIDQEHGRVNRLRPIVGELPTIAGLKTGGVERVTEFGREVGKSLRACGVELNFAPVVDLELFPLGTDNALQERCWGKTAAEVSVWAGAFLDGLQETGVAGCLKHFPGLGDSHQDSHEHLPTITRSREQLLAEDIQPYVALQSRTPAVMVGHGHYPSCDGDRPKPASVSREIITGLLRERVGFNGLVFTDDMEMGAILQYASLPDAAVEALAAGADVLLACHLPETILAIHEALVKAVESGRLTTQRLAESRARIDKLRQWLGR